MCSRKARSYFAIIEALSQLRGECLTLGITAKRVQLANRLDAVRYLSTRSGLADKSFTQILLEGLSEDGGLFLPESYPQLSSEQLEDWRKLLREQGYAALAAEVLKLFIDDIPASKLEELARRAYSTDRFSDEQIVPVTQIGDTDLWLAHTSLGPTAAFKDMAMQLLGELFEYELTNQDEWITILGATSGDTGSAAEYAMRGRERVSVVMLTPAGRMTPFQQAQMFTLAEPNIVNVAVEGVFDDCQDLVKAVNADAEFKANWHIGAVNSINWARLLAQLIYYIASWLRVTESVEQKITFVVPTGNFGNVLAGHIARQMGLPIANLVVATNENNVLEEFFNTGVYRVRSSAQTLATSSPSMDISKASNFERFIFDLLGRDAARTRELFENQLGQHGFFDLSQTPEFAELSKNFGFLAASSTHADRIATIAALWNEQGILIDPHTADGVHVAGELESGLAAPIVIMETALPVKFAETIEEAIGFAPELPAEFAELEGLPRRVVDIPNDVDAVKALIKSTVGQ